MPVVFNLKFNFEKVETQTRIDMVLLTFTIVGLVNTFHLR